MNEITELRLSVGGSVLSKLILDWPIDLGQLVYLELTHGVPLDLNPLQNKSVNQLVSRLKEV